MTQGTAARALFGLALLLTLSRLGRAAPDPHSWTLAAGTARLTLAEAGPGRYGVRLGAFVQPAPLAVEVAGEDGAAAWLTDGYQRVQPLGKTLAASGTLTTAHGTRFTFTDIYAPLPRWGAFTLTRRVEIATPSPHDAGFSTRFSLLPSAPAAMGDCEFFAPGIWYKDSAHLPPTALASHPTDRYFFFREDRLPLPLIAQRDRRTKTILLLAHLGGDPATFAGEDGLARIVDARMQFGALGLQNTERPSPTFLFPGTEGERTYTNGGSLNGNRWAYRSHPVRVGVAHRYRLLLQAGRDASFPAAVRRTWRTVYALQPPPLIRADLGKVYRDGIGLLATYIHPYSGTISVPFAAVVPTGEVNDTSSQMGFVGQALPVAALLLGGSLETNDKDGIAQASAALDFWADHALTPSGLPRTWYDVHPDGTWTWRNDHTFLRVASDGADGALRAWSISRRFGQGRPGWLRFCRRYGDWLIGAQNPDGSWFREYGLDGLPAAQPTDRRSRDPRTTDTTDQAIPFLVDLSAATGDRRYLDAARRAGEFCLRTVHAPYAYVGGTPDNPNVRDKEAGMMALEAFLALHDLDGDPRWLAAAAQAADYSETWVYAWNIPMPPGDPKIVFPHGRRTEGLSVIATGHSGADSYLAAAPFAFYRLWLLTGDAHYKDAARMLLHDTKQMLDWDGTLGYRYHGLQAEALSLPPRRGHGVAHWLPWLTVAQLTPLVRLRDTFGAFDIDAIEKRPLAERRRRNQAFGKTRGLR